MQLPLFPHLTLPLGAARRAARPAAPARPRRTYGPSNPPLFVAPIREPAPRRTPPPRPHPIHTKDPLREWADAHADEHREVLHALEHLPNDYHASVGYLRAHRPRTSGPALTFWNAPLSRAHAINALLTRGERSIVQVHVDCDLGKDKLYEYVARWGMTFIRLERDHVQHVYDPQDRHTTGRALNINRQSATGEFRPDGYALTIPVTYDARARVFRTQLPLTFGPDALLSYEVAAHLLNLTPDTLRRVLTPDTHTARGDGLLRPESIERLLPRSAWYATLTAALSRVNTCTCPFFDTQTVRCGLDATRRLPEPGTAAYACEDHPA